MVESKCILGLDPSIKNTGYCILEASRDSSHAGLRWRDYGVIHSKNTKKPDYIRFYDIMCRVKMLWSRYKFDFVCLEAPLPWSKNPASLRVIPLYIQLCQVFSRFNPFPVDSLKLPSFFCSFIPKRLSGLIYEFNPKSKTKSGKIKDSVPLLKQLRTDLTGHVLADHTADAYFAGYFGFRYWQFLTGLLTDLSPKETQFFNTMKTDTSCWWFNEETRS